MAQGYNSPTTGANAGTASSIGTQIRTDHYYRKALIAIRDQQYFTPLASHRAMPKHMGKEIKQYQYIPVLDKANLNDQGIDAANATLGPTKFTAYAANGSIVGTSYATSTAALTAAGAGGTAVETSGNLYGSSRDIGSVMSKIPTLGENGGKMNRIGFARKTLTGTFAKQGFYSDYTQESMDFDTDSERMQHIVEESLVAANQILEDQVQNDLVSGAGVKLYTGLAGSDATVTGEGATPSVLTYKDLQKLSITIDKNKCPKNTKIITGSKMVDTKVVNATRYVYIPPELEMQVRNLTIDGTVTGKSVFNSVETYAAAGNVAPSEIGAIGQFRFIVVPTMKYNTGGGATAAANAAGYGETNGKYNVYHMLVVGSESFTTIGFQTDGKHYKFAIKDSKPGSPESYANDKFGETGFYSIKWYYGTMILRPEWIATLKMVGDA